MKHLAAILVNLLQFRTLAAGGRRNNILIDEPEVSFCYRPLAILNKKFPDI